MQCLYTRYPVATGGLYPPPGLWPFHILHFPFSPLIGCMRESWHFFFLFCYAPHVMFWKHSNKENLAGHALSTVVILNNAGACCACSGKTGDSGLFFFSWPSWQLRKFHCQWLLIRSVIGGLYVPFLLHLAFVWCAIDISFSQLLVVESLTET